MVWNHGMRYYFSTSIKEIGSMGVGMYLYFWMVRIVSIMFLCCSIFSIPAMVLNHQVHFFLLGASQILRVCVCVCICVCA